MKEPKSADEEFISDMDWDKNQGIAFKPFRPDRIAEQKRHQQKEAIAELIAGLNKIDGRPTKYEFIKAKEQLEKRNE